MHTISTLLTLERLIDAELERRFLGVQFEEKNLTARDKVIYGQYNDFHKKVYATCYELGLIESVTNEVITLNKNKIFVNFTLSFSDFFWIDFGRYSR